MGEGGVSDGVGWDESVAGRGEGIGSGLDGGGGGVEVDGMSVGGAAGGVLGGGLEGRVWSSSVVLEGGSSGGLGRDGLKDLLRDNRRDRE